MNSAKAPRNKTLTVTPDEVKQLQPLITEADAIDSSMDFSNRLIHGDLLQVIDTIPDAIADLIIIDPPYNLRRNFNGRVFNIMNRDAYDKYLRTWFGSVCRKLKPNGTLYLCGDWKCTSSLQRVMSEHLTILNRITWQREKGRGAKSNWKNSMEDIWFGVMDAKDYTFNITDVMMKRKVLAPYRADGKPKDWQEDETGRFRDTCPSNFWDDISVPFWSMPENTDHPTQKPEKLYAKLILASSNAGDIVLDPFMGSGTACVVAKKLQRRYLGIEINDEYCTWAAKRIQMADSDTSIQGYHNGVFWERNTRPQDPADPSTPHKKRKNVKDETLNKIVT